MNQPGLLDGLRFLVTRPAAQGEKLCQQLEEAGGQAEHFPALEIRHTAETVTLPPVACDWVIFISPNAVDYALAEWQGRLPSALGIPRVAAIGSSTARKLESAGITVSLVPRGETTSESLLTTPEMRAVSGKVCMIVRGEGGRQLLSDTLEARGARVFHGIVYRRVKPAPPPDETRMRWFREGFDLVIVTSGESLQNLLELWGDEAAAVLKRCWLLVVSRRIEIQAQALGFDRILVADGASDAAVMAAIREHAGALRKRY